MFRFFKLFGVVIPSDKMKALEAANRNADACLKESFDELETTLVNYGNGRVKKIREAREE